MTASNPRAISTAREERIREEDAARTLDGASVGPEADVRDLLLQLDHERAELMRVTWGRDIATTRRNDLARELDAERASVAERIVEHSRGVVTGIAGAMCLDASGEGDAVHARIIAEHERLTRALATARAAYDTDLAGLRDELRKYMDAAALQREERRLTATEGEIAQGRLLNLLARVHRDGGHYVSEHGVEKACEDADEIVAGLFGEKSEREALRDAVREHRAAEAAYDDAERERDAALAVYDRARDREALREAEPALMSARATLTAARRRASAAADALAALAGDRQ